MSASVAVAGLGIGKAHLAALHERMPDVRIAAVCDLNGKLAQEQAARFGTQAFEDYGQMLDRARPDGVILATPPKVHAGQTALAVERGVHVFCEKPMAPNAADCERMIESCARAGVALMIGFKKRFYPCYLFIRDRVRQSGNPLMWANVRFALGRVEKDWFWAEDNGGGPLLENAIHEYDILRFLMGDVKEVFAFGGNLFLKHRGPQIDAAAATLRFESGAVAGMGIGYGSEWGMAREELALASADLAIELQGPFDRPDSLRYVQRSSPAQIERPQLPALDATTPFELELRHFVACMQGKAKCESTGQDGLASVRIALAVKRSVREGRVVAV